MGPPGPKINVVYFDEAIHFGEGRNEESGDEEGGDEEGGNEETGDEEGGEEALPVDSAIFSQRYHLTAHEESYLIDNFPPADSFIGLPFVTILTRSNINLHNMVCFQVTILSYFLLYS